MSEEKFKILCVDDEPDIVSTLRRVFRKDYDVTITTSGLEAIELIKMQPFDLIISDQRMPGVTGDEVLKFAMMHQPEAIRILLTGYSDMESLIKCVNDAGIYKYLTKPWEPEMLRLTVVRALESLGLKRKLALFAKELKNGYLDVVTMLSVACEGRDEDTGFHVLRVQHYTEQLALEMGVSAEDAEHFGIMSILHDIGKLYIPDIILKKPARLDDVEWSLMQRHAEFGIKILGENPFFSVAREIAGAHHEKFDGSGYPKGLKGNDIPLSARIVAVADVFDALTSHRPYKEAWPVEKAITTMQTQAGLQFDPEIIEGFKVLLEKGAIQKIMQSFYSMSRAEYDFYPKNCNYSDLAVGYNRFNEN
jgi:putative two-component system response regulator